MGYNTVFLGEIRLSNKKAYEALENALENEAGPFSEKIVESYLEEKDMTFVCRECWKNYDDNMERICLFVLKIDKHAEGLIECSGENIDDHWKITIKNGKVIVHQSGRRRRPCDS